MENDNLVDSIEPIDNHPDHEKFYLDGIEDSSAEIATAVENAIREQHDIDDSADLYVDTVDIDASDNRFKVGATVIDNEPLRYAPFGESIEPNAADNDDVRHSVVDEEHYLWEENGEDSATLSTFSTMYTDYDGAEVTPADLRANEIDHSTPRTPKEKLNSQFTHTVIETESDGCDLYVAWERDEDPTIENIDLPEGWNVCERVGASDGLEFIAPDTEVYESGFSNEKRARDVANESDNYHYSNVDGHYHVWSEEKIDKYIGGWTPRQWFSNTITPAVLRANLVE